MASIQDAFPRENGMYILAALNSNRITPRYALELCEAMAKGEIKQLGA